MNDSSARGRAELHRPPWDAGHEWTARAIYSLAFLTLISSLNYLDRSILGLALPLIKREMHLTDTVLGLVTGLPFAIFYTLLGVPIASLADRSNRRNIIAAGFAFWSLMTACTGLVANAWQLAGTRLLMGVGEACGTPPSNSILSDLFTKAERPLALALFGTAFSLSLVIYFPIVGWICEHSGWRAAFIAAGAPGIALALVFILTVREPQRGARDPQAASLQVTSMTATLRYLAGSRAYVFMALGTVFTGAIVYAMGAWNSSFLVRVHHLSIARIASIVGPIQGVLGGLGVVLGGVLTERLGRRDERWRIWIPAIAAALVAPALALFLLGQSLLAWASGLALTSLLVLIPQGPIYAACMNVALPRMRAVAIAFILLCAGLVGQVAGPLLIGALNDMLSARYGAAAIRYSMLTVVGWALGAALAYLAAARHISQDSQRAAGA
jgi:MFS family permease